MRGTVDSPTYRAFKAAGVDDATAEAAAHAVVRRDERMAKVEREIMLLKWMVGLVFAVQLAGFAAGFATLWAIWSELTMLSDQLSQLAG